MDLKEINEKLNFYIRPQTFPVAIKLVVSREEVPPKARIPSRDLGYGILVCQAMAMARRLGWTVALERQDMSCAPAVVGMGFVRSEEIQTPKEAAPRTPPRKLEYGKYQHLVIAPLHSATFEPDALIVYGSPAQMMRLAQSFSFEGKKVNALASGFGDCIDIVTVRDDPDPTLILASGGDRVFGTTQDFELIFVIPWARVEETVKGLETTHQMGFRYPIISSVAYKAQLPPFLDLQKMLKQAQ